ncbi:hypothetical protein CFIMG_004395RA [Ceratocystis fimbriata CBS 114723]|uniref:Cytochrome c oxidase copper chaperone n=1 Tax=Ceratocystis fimbriata CBS 114723 TaxID=1035309 RepID=A0A2C5WYX5_9PEZI|nr:hypothetical protein CFIMG_004395RA [Ceratocystis fimbriata CBS 114723]
MSADTSCPIPAASTAVPAASTDAPSKPKPCCVCKEEKARRDECMLFSKAADPAADCAPAIAAYKACMAGFGFKI